jgi:hypothetical protein
MAETREVPGEMRLKCSALGFLFVGLIAIAFFLIGLVVGVLGSLSWMNRQ